MDLESTLLLLAAGLLAGAMNAAAGGGSFVSIPAMVFVGLPSVAANVSSTVALLPGTLASAWAWRRDYRSLQGISLVTLLAISLVGGLGGALLLLATTQRLFDGLLPWLLLTGTLAFTFGRPLGAALRKKVQIGQGTVITAQVLLSVYAGYFGGGVGIMMMAVWGLLGDLDIKAMSALRTLLVSAANLVAVACFAIAGPVFWPETLVMLVAAIAGGYLGALLASRMPASVLRGFVILFGTAMTVLFFWRAYG
ncbi:sulfite exporter TauE/SafE family protein [Roseomonas sp. SSH11]|uniref:Probable membrane transporter protein n=1 Tax=Pararoseomonas baculiformis TaxID=2820812 RepID=A0ABS4AFZ3_9PROT|nr:sulfite exporter TauE/SafE family protein [Pararoseomonas baculiformis]MBP0445921.1 sulfite exporter TauE/SafE family protein [Pararoseomonas baculiformis]